MARRWFDLAVERNSPDPAQVSVFGIPYDGSVFFRPGAARGPSRIRSLSSKVPAVSEEGRILDHLRVCDLGMVEPRGDLAAFHLRIEKRFREARAAGLPLAFGGDHSVSIPLLAAAGEHAGRRHGLIWIDAHPDLCDLFSGSKYSHACVLRRALEGRYLQPEDVVMLGIRSYEVEEVRFIRDHSMDVRGPSRLERADPAAVGTELVARFAGMPVYLSIDIDGFDPAYAPGTGIPDAGGLSTRWVIDFLHALMPIELLGIDIVEVAPPLDSPSDQTSLLALKLMLELLANVDANAVNVNSE